MFTIGGDEAADKLVVLVEDLSPTALSDNRTPRHVRTVLPGSGFVYENVLNKSALLLRDNVIGKYVAGFCWILCASKQWEEISLKTPSSMGNVDRLIDTHWHDA